MIKARQVSDGVFVAEDAPVRIDEACLASLLLHAERNPRRRARLCAHKTNESRIHEMFIALTKETYIRPHRHVGKSESFYVIYGTATVIFFDDAGNIAEVLEIGDYRSGLPFCYRNEDSRYHTQIVTSNALLVHETTNGPFDPTRTLYAPWSPEENEHSMVREYLAALLEAAAAFQQSSR
jgi:cupin fold WbuC family metalloprotein